MTRASEHRRRDRRPAASAASRAMNAEHVADSLQFQPTGGTRRRVQDNMFI